PLACADYQTNGYTLAGYLATYDPAVWGTAEPSGPLEDARAASAALQTARVGIKVGANTTIIGLPGARLLGADLLINKVDNVIIRNVTFEHAFDCFPQWDPTDGATGAWNSLYDNVSLTGATHVWVDHNTFTDGSHPDSLQPTYFGDEFQQHDGELDITKASDLVTVEWNQFRDHDKTNLLGSSNTVGPDVGKLRITMHHNLYANILQRAPRVRFGQVHVYNNLYVVPGGRGYLYSWGVGVQSQIFAESNFFLLGSGVTADKVIFNWGGTDIHAANNLVNGRPTDLLAAFNAANPTTPIGSATTWTPTLHTRIDPAWLVPLTVALGAGAGHLR
ncbi:MAG: pectate lyase, partial [Mycobacteriales bacterium]